MLAKRINPWNNGKQRELTEYWIVCNAGAESWMHSIFHSMGTAFIVDSRRRLIGYQKHYFFCFFFNSHVHRRNMFAAQSFCASHLLVCIDRQGWINKTYRSATAAQWQSRVGISFGFFFFQFEWNAICHEQKVHFMFIFHASGPRGLLL